ncbi:MAG: hypothetical protein B6240_09230, partial [Desulfobacteraceae bacterium 4572_87]
MKTMMIRFLFLGICLLTALCACGDEPVSSKESQPPEAPGPRENVRQVSVKVVEANPPKGEMAYVGVLEAYLKVRISNEIGGMIEKLYFEKGEPVKQGDLLAEIGSRSIRLQVREAEAARNAAKSNLKKMEKGSRPQEIQIATASVQEAEAAFSEAQKNFSRIGRLHEIRAVSNSAYDSAERQMSTAKARMDTAKQRLDLARKGPRDEDVGTVRAQLGQAEAALALMEDRLEKSIIHAPING